MTREKTLDDHKKIVGGRIRQARLMSGHETIAALNEKFPEWSNSRLGNYETGKSLPNPLEIMKIAKATETSPCWITFGIGTIRSMSRELQPIRHQNLTYLEDNLSKSELTALRNSLKLKPKDFINHINNPFLKITDTMCLKIEKHLGKQKNWMSEQHIDTDGLCMHYPEDIRKILTIYSNLDKDGKQLFLGLTQSLSDNYKNS